MAGYWIDGLSVGKTQLSHVKNDVGFALMVYFGKSIELICYIALTLKMNYILTKCHCPLFTIYFKILLLDNYLTKIGTYSKNHIYSFHVGKVEKRRLLSLPIPFELYFESLVTLKSFEPFITTIYYCQLKMNAIGQ